MKICIVKLSSIGDIIHNAFVPSLIKKHIPNVEIHWVCDKNFTEVIQHNPFITKIHPVFSKGAGKSLVDFVLQLFKLRKVGIHHKFDTVIDLQGTLKSAIITQALCINSNTYGFKFTRDIAANKLYKNHCNTPLQTNVYERAIQMLKTAFGINVTRNEIQTPFVYTKNWINKVNGDILIFPSSSKPEKNYSVENYRTIIKDLQRYNVTLLFGNKDEAELCHKIAKGFNNITVIGGLSLEYVKHEILSHSCIIGGDTGILHIASGLGIPNITLYGPTPAYRTSIHQKYSIALQGNGDTNKIPTNEVILAVNSFNV